MEIRRFTPADADALWGILEPVLRAGETYALPADWTRAEALAFWTEPAHQVFVAAEEGGSIVGTYYLQANGRGGAAHVANCGYVTASSAAGRGVASAMCAHSLAEAVRSGFRAMQFNCVVSTNTRAIALWQRFGFAIVGTLPDGFRHPAHGFVDAYVMMRPL